MKTTFLAAFSALSASAAWILLAACSSSSNGGTASNLPAISADKLGKTCTGFGTSPGDTATFKDSDCGAGYCLVDLTGNDILSYCTADCDVYSCPSGYVCKPNTLGETKHACFVDPNASGDSGVCTQPTGTYSTHFVARDTTNCPPLSDNTVTYDLKDAGTGCEQSFDQASCTFTTNCTTTQNGNTIQTTDVVTVPVDNSTLTDVLTVVYSGSGQNLTCVYDVSDTKR